MGLILGRSPNLWLGAVTAIWGVIVAVEHIDPVIAGLVITAAGAIVALIAGSDSIQIAAGNAAQVRQGK
jgi:hypothetical protein